MQKRWEPQTLSVRAGGARSTLTLTSVRGELDVLSLELKGGS